MLTNPSGLFPDSKFRLLGVLAPQIFTRTRDWLWFTSAHPKQWQGWGVPWKF